MADEISVTPPNFADFKDSVIRTLVPYLVANVAVWAANAGLAVDDITLTGWVTFLVALAYYASVRWVEQRWPNAGWLLGKAKVPVYVDTKQVEDAKINPLVEG